MPISPHLSYHRWFVCSMFLLCWLYQQGQSQAPTSCWSHPMEIKIKSPWFVMENCVDSNNDHHLYCDSGRRGSGTITRNFKPSVEGWHSKVHSITEVRSLLEASLSVPNFHFVHSRPSSIWPLCYQIGLFEEGMVDLDSDIAAPTCCPIFMVVHQRPWMDSCLSIFIISDVTHPAWDIRMVGTATIACGPQR